MQKLNESQKEYIATNLRRFMADHGHGQKEVSIKTHTDQGTVSKILNGRFVGLNKTVLRICKYAKITPSNIPNLNYRDDLLDEFVAKFVEAWGGSIKERQAVIAVLMAVREVALVRSNSSKK